MPGNKFFDENTLNSPPKIIIKKENIGLEEYQHQKYQFNLFNNTRKRDQYYEDLGRVKDRLEKAVPSMKQVAHADMKRINTNKVYERKLERDLTGPRGLNWQRKQELQRLENNERDIERDLMRLNRDLARIAFSSPLGQSSVPNENHDPSQVQTGNLSSTTNINPTAPILPKTKLDLERSISVGTSRATVGLMTLIHQKRLSLNQTNSFNERSSIDKPIFSKANEERPYLQQHGLMMDREKRKIEQKLKLFLN
ncbi:unnamed protein product [Rotaria sp. Silwood1]|nr:unnamed protein product [Rotaria sp. Silwood1]CAF0864580.1 unnamed protein product [Rotaria sp. Silwood1]CAF3365583.1 unnamed protein product [Rotaria sp. Silwood1]CAF3388274.1 unnamed protein product [Rotaria sp. Silwood1]CAF3388507.1 unnamed protein product [Rotaria sp. Silwood1]